MSSETATTVGQQERKPGPSRTACLAFLQPRFAKRATQNPARLGGRSAPDSSRLVISFSSGCRGVLSLESRAQGLFSGLKPIIGHSTHGQTFLEGPAVHRTREEDEDKKASEKTSLQLSSNMLPAKSSLARHTGFAVESSRVEMRSLQAESAWAAPLCLLLRRTHVASQRP